MYNMLADEYSRIVLAEELLGSVKGKNFLDLGCATGDLALALARRGELVEAFDKHPAVNSSFSRLFLLKKP